ncbi:MAG: hypothetical protein ABR589_07915 [Chthoniobacterales bacterium]
MKMIAGLLLLSLVVGTGCKSAAKRQKEKQAAQAKKDAQTTEDNADVDFQAFIGRLRKAVQARDMNAVAGMMTPDFAFVMGATADQDRKGEGVFQYWEENGLWPELEGILSEKFVKKEEYMVAPPQFASHPEQYTGYRAGIRRVGGSWKFAYFVN